MALAYFKISPLNQLKHAFSLVDVSVTYVLTVGLCCVQGRRAGGRFHMSGNHVCHILLSSGNSLLPGPASEEMSKLWSHLRLEGPKNPVAVSF